MLSCLDESFDSLSDLVLVMKINEDSSCIGVTLRTVDDDTTSAFKQPKSQMSTSEMTRDIPGR